MADFLVYSTLLQCSMQGGERAARGHGLQLLASTGFKQAHTLTHAHAYRYGVYYSAAAPAGEQKLPLFY